jgi:hypothetical protein
MRYFEHAPRCYGSGRHPHAPIFAQRRGFDLIHGRLHPVWECPVCGMRHFR